MLQNLETTTIVEAALNAVDEASKKSVHLGNLLQEIDLELQQPLNVFVDN